MEKFQQEFSDPRILDRNDTFCFNPNFFFQSKKINILSIYDDDFYE